MKQGWIVAVCRSDRKGVAKQAVATGRLICGHGIENDAHAGNWHRQVSLLDIGDIREMEAKGLTLKPGAFGENLVLAGVDTAELGLGSRLKLGRAEIEITQIGKVCHDRCAIYYSAGDCIMPRRGLFAEVRADGAVEAGTPVDVVCKVPRHHLQAAVLMADGDGGEEIVKSLDEHEGVHLTWSGPLPVGSTLPEAIRQLCGRGLNLLVVVSNDRQSFAGAIDSGTGEPTSAGLKGRVATTTAVLVDHRPGFQSDVFVTKCIAEVRRDSVLVTATLPTVSLPRAGAR